MKEDQEVVVGHVFLAPVTMIGDWGSDARVEIGECGFDIWYFGLGMDWNPWCSAWSRRFVLFLGPWTVRLHWKRKTDGKRS